jgi:hypothetical protein
MMDSMQTEMELVASRMRERDRRFRPSTTNVYILGRIARLAARLPA